MFRIITLALTLLATTTMANNGFEKIIGEKQCYDEGISMVQLPDGSHLVSGAYNCGGGTANWKSMLVKLNANGDTAWVKRNLMPNGLMKLTPDGNLIFLGGSSAGMIYDKVQVTKAGLDGEVIWTKSFSFSSCNNSGMDIIATNDGGYAFTGIFIDNCASASFNSYMVKLDAAGNVEWQKTFGTAGDDQLTAIRQMKNGHYALFGWTTGYGADGIDFWLIKTDEAGSLLMTETYGGAGNQYGYGMDVTYDGGFILNGYDDNMMAIKTNNWGTIEWKQDFGLVCGGNYFRAVQAADGGYIFTGSQEMEGECRTALFKTDSEGNTEWNKNWEGRLRNITIVNNSTILLAGYVAYLPDLAAVRYETNIRNLQNVGTADGLGNNPVQFGIHGDVDEEFNDELPSGIKSYGLEDVKTSSMVYPNPSTGVSTLKFSNPDYEIFHLDLFDINGARVRNIANIMNDEVTLYQLDLPKGSYIYKLSGSNGDIYMGKVVFQ